MSAVDVKPLPRGTPNTKHRLSLGMAVMPDVKDDKGWDTIVEMGVPHYCEWSQGIVSKGIAAFALSYKHTEHDFGKLSREQASELRYVLKKLVGTGPNKAILWIDSMYMTRESMGLEDFSSEWVHYGLSPYSAMPVIRLTSQWANLHPKSGKRSAWLWLEWTLGKYNKGVHTAQGDESESNTGLRVMDALRMWLQVEKDYGFRPADEKDVRAEIDGKSAATSARFHCPGRSSCIGYILGRRSSACRGTSDECIQLAKSVNGSYFQDKLILTTTARVAEHVLTVIEESEDGTRAFLQQENLSKAQLQEYTKVLISRKLPFRNIRWLNLDRF